MTESTGASGQIKAGFQSEAGRAVINELKNILGGEKSTGVETDLVAKSKEATQNKVQNEGGFGQRGVVV